jgi:putative ABC transport system ATP-binding protein
VAPLFSFEGVWVELGGASVLRDVDLEIADRGITVLAGPSGAGKSTLLRLCNRLEVPTAGTVRYCGDDVTDLDPLRHRRAVGMVFQRPTPFAGTVRDNLRVACREGDDRHLASALERAGLDGAFLDRRADDLSGGESQRMCLARTLLAEPDVLLLDEPTSALDPRAARDLEREALALAGDGGVPMVWVTHDLLQAERVGTEVVVLVDGRVASGEERDRFLAGEG